LVELDFAAVVRSAAPDSPVAVADLAVVVLPDPVSARPDFAAVYPASLDPDPSYPADPDLDFVVAAVAPAVAEDTAVSVHNYILYQHLSGFQ